MLIQFRNVINGCHYLPFVLGFACVALTSAVAQQTGAVPVTTWTGAALDDAFNYHRTFPVLSNGYLLSFRRIPKNASVVLYSPSSGGRWQTSFDLPDSAALALQDAIPTRDSKVVLVGSYTRLKDHHDVNFLAEMDLGGRVRFTADLGDYTPTRVCSAPDGSFWTLGHVWGNEKSARGGQYSILRNYGPNGQFTRGYLSRQNLPAPAIDLRPPGRTYGNQVTPAFLSCGEQSVGALIVQPGGQQWIEVNYASGSSKLWTIPDAPKGANAVSGLVLVGENTVYASFASLKNGARLHGVYSLSLQPNGKGAWTAAHGQAVLSGRVVGTDGSGPIVLRGTPGAGGPRLDRLHL